jgi:hypothetical protein
LAQVRALCQSKTTVVTIVAQLGAVSANSKRCKTGLGTESGHKPTAGTQLGFPRRRGSIMGRLGFGIWSAHD